MGTDSFINIRQEKVQEKGTKKGDRLLFLKKKEVSPLFLRLIFGGLLVAFGQEPGDVHVVE